MIDHICNAEFIYSGLLIMILTKYTCIPRTELWRDLCIDERYVSTSEFFCNDKHFIAILFKVNGHGMEILILCRRWIRNWLGAMVLYHWSNRTKLILSMITFEKSTLEERKWWRREKRLIISNCFEGDRKFRWFWCMTLRMACGIRFRTMKWVNRQLCLS